MALFERISENFTAIQRNSAAHPKAVQTLKKVYLETEDKRSFLDFYTKCIHTFLKADLKVTNPFVERAVQFISAYCITMQEHHMNNVDPEQDSEIVKDTIGFLVRMSNVVPDNVRNRACQFISKIFLGLTGYELTVELCDTVQDAMLQSLEDKVYQTRILAVIALGPLQNLENMHCPVISAFLDHMEFDPSAKVRRVCADKIVLKREIIPHMIETSRDVDVNVKLTVFKRALRFPNNFKILHKQQLLYNGFKDESDMIKKFVSEQLVPAWLQYYDCNYIKLLSGLRLDSTWADIEMTTTIVEYTLSTLFILRPTSELLEVLQLDDDKLVRYADLGWDTAFYWRFFLEQLCKTNNEDNYIPQLPALCKYIKTFCELSMNEIQEKSKADESSTQLNLKFKFILVQLFHIVKTYDYVDIALRKCINDLIVHVFQTYNLDLEVINVIVHTLNKTIPDVNVQTKYVCDLLGDLLYSNAPTNENTNGKAQGENRNDELLATKSEYEVAQFKIKYYSLLQELEDAVKAQDFNTASELKAQVEDAKKQMQAVAVNEPEVVTPEETEENEEEPDKVLVDPAIMKRVLLVMAGFLTTSKIKSFNATLRTFKVSVIDEHVNSGNMHVRIAAMRCLSLCCTLDEHTACMAIPSFYAIIMAHNRMSQYPPPAELVLICIGTVVDALLLFGTKLFANPPENSVLCTTMNEEEQEVLSGGITLSAVVKELLDLLNDENAHIQFMAGRGICNFILTSRIQSHAVITRLILKYVSPTSTEEDSLKLQQYIGGTLGKLPTIPSTAAQLHKAILPAIKIILKAPQNNPLSCVDIDNTMKLLIDLVGSYGNYAEIYQNIVLDILKEIGERPNSPNNISLSKMLLMVKISDDDKVFLKDAATQIDEVRDRVHDNKAGKVSINLIKFNARINDLLQTTTQETVME